MVSDGICLEEILSERLTGLEKKIRELGNACNEHQLLFRLNRYPLSIDEYQYELLIIKRKGDKKFIIFKKEGMELLPIINDILKALKKYNHDHKVYDLSRPGGGNELI